MDTQLSVRRRGDKPEESKLIKPEGDKRDKTWRKPFNGFWTSTFKPEEESSHWVEWCLEESFDAAHRHPWYLLEVDPYARIYTIDSKKDLLALVANYHYSHDQLVLDWESIFKDYDGVHLTEQGNDQCHWGQLIDMNSWDVESTVWGRWVFKSVELYIPSDEAVERMEETWNKFRY